MCRLAAASERASFHPSGTTDDMVDASWDDADAIMRELRLTASVGERVRSMVSPRVLIGAVRGE